MSDERLRADKITLGDAIEKIGQARHGSAWATAAANELQATEEASAGSNTIKNVREAQERVKILRRPIELEILDKLGKAQLSAHWRDSNGKLLPIASGHWNLFEVEANKYWPNAKINGKQEIAYLDAAALAAFIDSDSRQAQRRGAPMRYDWPDIKEYAFKLWKERGDFLSWDIASDWRSPADLERKVSDYIAKREEKVPAESTVRRYVSTWLIEWRKADK